MPEATETDASTEAAPKRKRKLILILPVLLLLIAGGTVAFFYLRPVAGKSDAAKSEKSAASKEKKKASKNSDEDAEDGEETAKSKSNSTPEVLKSVLPEDEEVKQVVELQPFVVNLADTEEARYLRLTVSVGVGESGEKPDALFITRVRNAMLGILSGKKSDEILTVEGKKTLRKELLNAAQAASEEPHVQAIYITDFIVQL